MTKHEFEQAIEARRPRLLRVARNMVGREAAPDVVQGTLASAYTAGAWQSLDADALARWLTSALQDDCKNYLESLNRGIDHEAQFVARQSRPTQDEDDLVRKIDVARALSSLPDDVRRAVIAVFMEEASWQDVAQELGVPRKTLQDRVNKYLPYLRELLRPNAPAARIQEVRSSEEEEVA